MISKTHIVIFAVVTLVIFGSDAVFIPCGSTEEAAERDNCRNIDSTVYNVDFYPKVQPRISIVAKESSYEALNWTCPINESGDRSDIWYTYLNSLYCELSRYEIQVAKKSYNVADLNDWGLIHVPNLKEKFIYDTEAWKSNEGQGIKINKSNFGIFLNKTERYNIAEQASIRKMTITEKQLKELNHVLDLTIKDEIYITCAEPFMFVTGNYIIVSHIKLSILAGTVDESCRELLNTDRLKYMNIFALNTIFIDKNMRERMNLVTIVAPKWEVIGRRRIRLDGKNGELQDTAAPTEKDWNRNGIDGNPGEPGEPGGNFFGIGEVFSGGKNLIISVSGGNGSSGQDGGNGSVGENGISPRLSHQCNDKLCNDGKTPEGFTCSHLKCTEEDFSTRTSIYIKTKCSYQLYGKKGLPGGNGGNGGKGGEGGYPGDTVFIELNGRSGVKQIKNCGSNGSDGKGGIGGVGGMEGNEIIEAECSADNYYNRNYESKPPISDKRTPSGQNGSDGGNIKNLQERRKAICISKADKAKILNQYKIFLIANINDPFRKIFLEKFLNRLEDNQDLKNIYDTLGFIDELKSLIEQFHNLNEETNFIPFYKSLLDRISEYALNVENSNDKKVLGYLYTATLSRKYNLEDELESDLITDVPYYFKLIKSDIKMLKQLEDGKTKKEIINKYKQDYKDEIDKKIKDANDLISKEILPEIDNIQSDIDRKIENLVIEVIDLQKQARKNVKKLNKKRLDLKNKMALQTFFGSLKILGQVISLIGPAGTVAGTLLGVGSSVAEANMLDNLKGSDSTVTNLEKNQKELERLNKQINSLSDKNTEGLKNALQIVSQEIAKHPEIFESISADLSDIKSRLDTFQNNDLNIKVLDLETELKTLLKTLKNNTIRSTQKSTNGQETNNAVEVIDHLLRDVELSLVVVNDPFDKYKENNELDEMHKAIQQNEEEIFRLKQYEDNIYRTIVPVLKNVINDLNDMINSSTKTKVALDVTKWKVQSTLKDLMVQMQQATRNFDVQESLVRCIEKLHEAMVMLLHVQSYIQDYQKDQTLANFIAGVSSITVNDIAVPYSPILDGGISDALRDLEITIRASIIIQRYKVAVDALKQYVFPFAHLYLKGTMLPSHLELVNKNYTNLNDVIYRTVTQIEQIESKLEYYKGTVNKHDQCTGSGEFNHKYNKPFFVWKNEKNKDMISKLLSGEEVIVKADIMNSPPEFDAIKFNWIEFYFKSKNKSIEVGINKVLEKFWINATHLGNSYYRYDNKIYLLTTVDLSIWYYFKKKASGNPSLSSTSYDEIKKGDFLLSPYAMWKLKLLNKTKKISFEDLKIYKHDVNLVLGGNGFFVNKGDSNCLGLEVDKYYEAIKNVDAEYRMVESNADGSVPLLKDNFLTRGKHEINRESVTVNEELQNHST